MINNKSSLQKFKYNNVKFIFYIICILYFAGLLTGCTFAIKNSRNMAFVEKVTFTGNFIENANSGDLNRYRLFYIRDIACVVSILLLKYSGILKGICVCIPFFQAVQNSSIATADFINDAGIINIISGYLLRNTATAFIVIIFCTTVVKDILNNRAEPGKDIEKTAVYSAGITLVFILDFAVKNMFL